MSIIKGVASIVATKFFNLFLLNQLAQEPIAFLSSSRLVISIDSLISEF